MTVYPDGGQTNQGGEQADRDMNRFSVLYYKKGEENCCLQVNNRARCRSFS
jgi:hypothetical protein